MAVSPVTARPQKDLVLSTPTTSYQKHVSNVAWTPTQASINWQGGTPDAALADVGPASWSASVTAVQDWGNPESFVNYCLKHAGEKVALTFKPHADATFSLVATVTLVAPVIGGAVNAFNESTLVLPSTPPVVTYPANTP